MIKTHAGRLLSQIYLPLTLLQGFEKGYSRLACERELRPNINCNILTPKLMAVNVVSFSFFLCSTGGPEATLLGDGFLYGILSASSPDLNSSGPKGPFGLMWLSLPHLVYNSVSCCLQLHWPRRTQLSYISFDAHWIFEIECLIVIKRK